MQEAAVQVTGQSHTCDLNITTLKELKPEQVIKIILCSLLLLFAFVYDDQVHVIYKKTFKK